MSAPGGGGVARGMKSPAARRQAQLEAMIEALGGLARTLLASPALTRLETQTELADLVAYRIPPRVVRIDLRLKP